jgi:UDP-GlcNAc3NAcA epimerase
LKRLKLIPGQYLLATIHRHNNTDETNRLESIFGAINKITVRYKENIVIPLHPRTKKALENYKNGELFNQILANNYIKLQPSVSYLDMIALERNARIIMTDSGGVQKEAYYFKKPCLILLNETPWVELVNNGCALLVDADVDKITKAYDYFLHKQEGLNFEPVFGDGHAAEFTVEMIIKYLSKD